MLLRCIMIETWKETIEGSDQVVLERATSRQSKRQEGLRKRLLT